MPDTLNGADLADVARAKRLLENRSLALKISNLFGAPIDAGLALLPKNWSGLADRAARAALFRALRAAAATTRAHKRGQPANRMHKILAGASGGLGGAFGLPALIVELPFTTTLMLRSIVDIARSQGHDIREGDTKAACLEVFALGGAGSAGRDEAAYWGTRMALRQALKEAASHLARQGALERTAPALIRFIALIAPRFAAVVTEEAAAKALPVLGAVGGSAVNIMFMDHFQKLAEGHFILLRLEKKFSAETVRKHFEAVEI